VDECKPLPPSAVEVERGRARGGGRGGRLGRCRAGGPTGSRHGVRRLGGVDGEGGGGEPRRVAQSVRRFLNRGVRQLVEQAEQQRTVVVVVAPVARHRLGGVAGGGGGGGGGHSTQMANGAGFRHGVRRRRGGGVTRAGRESWLASSSGQIWGSWGHLDP